jgi:hypothetical protein
MVAVEKTEPPNQNAPRMPSTALRKGYVVTPNVSLGANRQTVLKVRFQDWLTGQTMADLGARQPAPHALYIRFKGRPTGRSSTHMGRNW